MKRNKTIKINNLNQYLDSVRGYERSGRKKETYKKILEARSVVRTIINKKLFGEKQLLEMKKILRVNIKPPKKSL